MYLYYVMYLFINLIINQCLNLTKNEWKADNIDNSVVFTRTRPRNLVEHGGKRGEWVNDTP